MKIEFNEQQLQVLNAAIIELPYRISAPLINHINQQIQEQSAAHRTEASEILNQIKSQEQSCESMKANIKA